MLKLNCYLYSQSFELHFGVLSRSMYMQQHPFRSTWNIYFFNFKDYFLEHTDTRTSFSYYKYSWQCWTSTTILLLPPSPLHANDDAKVLPSERYSLDSVNKKVVSHCIKIKGPLSLNGVCCYKQKRICPFRLWMLDVSKMSWARWISG